MKLKLLVKVFPFHQGIPFKIHLMIVLNQDHLRFLINIKLRTRDNKKYKMQR